MRISSRSLVLAIALSSAAAPALTTTTAFAQAKTAADWFKEGEDQYNVGDFAAAITSFKEAYKIEPNESRKSAYLYNIAQAYRQMKQCYNAQFFFKRFLAVKEKDTVKPLSQKTRDTVEGAIRELEECARREEASAKQRPDENMTLEGTEPKPDPTPKPLPVVATKPVPDPEDTKVVTTTTADGPTLLSARLVGGGAVVSAGNLDIPIQATAALIGGYPIRLGDKLTFEAGAGFTFTPVPYVNMVTNESRNAALTSVFANGGITFEVIDKLGIRGDLGAGVLVFSGVSESPFTKGAPTSGALAMPHVRIGVSADYAITPNLLATATPFAFSFSPPKAGLREEIKAITAIDFMIGLGYRM